MHTQWKRLSRVFEVAQLIVAISVLGYRQRHAEEEPY